MRTLEDIQKYRCHHFLNLKNINLKYAESCWEINLLGLFDGDISGCMHGRSNICDFIREVYHEALHVSCLQAEHWQSSLATCIL